MKQPFRNALTIKPTDRPWAGDPAPSPGGGNPQTEIRSPAADPPEIAVVGSAEWCAQIVPVVERLQLTVRAMSLEAALHARDPVASRAVMFAPPRTQAVVWLDGHPGESTATFLVSRRGLPTEAVLQLYGRGAEAVLPNPSQTEELHQILAELLALRQVHGAPRGADRALARLVTAHLRACGPHVGRLKVRAKRGSVSIRGSARNFTGKREVLSLVEQLPGVRFVDVRRLVVRPSGRSDAELRDEAERALKTAFGVAPETLSLSVLNGRVHLAGTVRSRAEMAVVLRELRNVSGIRDLENLATIAPGQKRRDQELRRTLKRLLGRLLPDRDLRVSVFGGVAVVDGGVQNGTMRRKVSRWLRAREGVRRVVNRMEVDDPRLRVVR